MNIRLYNFTKKVNSTKTPSEAGVLYQGCIKDDTCSIMTPVITFSLSKTVAPTYNYCFIPDFNRYYFIMDWVYNKGLWVCYLAVDVLGSFKSSIRNSTQYVCRSATDADPYITDGSYNTKAQVKRNIVQLKSINYDLDNGIFIMGVMGSQYTREDTSYFSMTADILGRIFDFLYGSTDKWDLSAYDFGDSGINADVIKFISNPANMITSLMFLPSTNYADVSYGSESEVELRIGPLRTGIMVRTCHGKTYKPSSLSGEVQLSQHPQSGNNFKWLNANPYTRYQLTFKPFGSVELDPIYVAAHDFHIKYDVKIDIRTGEGILRVYSGDASKPDVFGYFSGQYGIQKSVGQMTQNLPQMYQANIKDKLYEGETKRLGITTTTSSIKALLPITKDSNGSATIGGLVNFTEVASDKMGEAQVIDTKRDLNSLDAKLGMVPVASGHGDNGGYINLSYTSFVCETFQYIVEPDPTEKGYLLMKHKSLNDIAGYTQIDDPIVECNATENEKTNIRQMMTNGFYLE